MLRKIPKGEFAQGSAPKGITVETRDDRTNADRVSTASNVLNLLKDMSVRKTTKEKQRKKKKAEKGEAPKRQEKRSS